VLDSVATSVQIAVMEFPDLRDALADHFGQDAEITSPEDESEAWRSIVEAHQRGQYPELLPELRHLLERADSDIARFLQSCAPAWASDSPADARHGIEVFNSYVSAHSE
jgi:hypothetical protein